MTDLHPTDSTGSQRRSAMQPNGSELQLGILLGQILDRTGTAIDIGVEQLHSLRRMERLLSAPPPPPPPPSAWSIIGRAILGVLRTREGIILAAITAAGLLGVISPGEVKAWLLALIGSPT